MIDNNKYFEETYKKQDLLEILKVFKFNKEYVWDKLVTEMGYKMLRLTSYHCVLNPIELIWHRVKSSLTHGIKVENSFIHIY